MDLKSKRWIELSSLLLLIFKNLKKSKILNFYAFLNKSNEGCQELSFIATLHKKCTIKLDTDTIHALQLYYSALQYLACAALLPCFKLEPH